MQALTRSRLPAATLLILVLTVAVLGPLALASPARAAGPTPLNPSSGEPAPSIAPERPAPRTTQDRLISAAAIGSIILVAVAGTYIYVLIRRGL